MKIKLVILELNLLVICFATGCICKHVPKEQKLGDCTNNILRFRMTITNFPPYQFVLGMPKGATNQLSFHGELIVIQSADTVAKIPIDSHEMTPCNWLSGLDGYILTWSGTNRADRLNGLLLQGKTYNIEVRFSETPPSVGSLWFGSMEKVCSAL